jgi:hypothetical protein
MVKKRVNASYTLANFGHTEEAREMIARSFSLIARDAQGRDPWRLAKHYYQAGLLLDQGLPGDVQHSGYAR